MIGMGEHGDERKEAANPNPQEIEERSRAMLAARDLAEVRDTARELRLRLDQATMQADRDLYEVDWDATRVRLAALERLVQWADGEISQMFGSLEQAYRLQREIHWPKASSADRMD